MEMQGQRQLGVTQQQAWEALNDPEMLKKCVPGCDKMELQQDGGYAVGMAVKIGPVSAKFSGKIALVDVNPPESYTLNFEGQGGVAGFGKGSSQVKLSPNEAGTLLDYSVNAQVGGKIAQLGQRLVDGAAKGMAEDFFSRFEAALIERYPQGEAVPPGGPAVPAQAPGQAQADKPGSSRTLWIVAGAVVLVLVYFMLRR